MKVMPSQERDHEGKVRLNAELPVCGDVQILLPAIRIAKYIGFQ